MENIPLPNNITFEAGEHPNEGVLVVEPCFHGYGTTLGNALRRVLLSSLPGAAVTAVKITGVKHEFQAVDNVKEDALQIILNLKDLRMKVYTDQPVKLTLSVSGKKTVTAGDIQPNSDVDIVNDDLKIATITDEKGSLEMEITVERGRGYSPIEERTDEDHDLGTIAVDALFSPIRNVGYKVEDTRVGDITNYDKLSLNIETDGSITPEEAVQKATQLLIDHFSLFGQAPAEPAEAPAEEEAAEEPAEESDEEESTEE